MSPAAQLQGASAGAGAGAHAEPAQRRARAALRGAGAGAGGKIAREELALLARQLRALALERDRPLLGPRGAGGAQPAPPHGQARRAP